ncbi:MAG: hypothetical protein ACXIVG_12000 [Pararhodobacter sp.]
MSASKRTPALPPTALPFSPLLLMAVPMAALLLSGCAGLQRTPSAPDVPVTVIDAPDDSVARPERRPGTAASGVAAAPRTALRPAGRTAEALDTTSEAERAAARSAAARPGGQALGETLAGLGAPTEGGFWLRTGLVTQPRPGRLVSASGASVAVELRPSGRAPGSGSEVSLAALRALDLPLTGLATLQVFATD